MKCSQCGGEMGGGVPLRGVRRRKVRTSGILWKPCRRTRKQRSRRAGRLVPVAAMPLEHTLLNPGGAITPKPDVDVKPRPVAMVTPYCSQIDAPAANHIPAPDIRRAVEHEICDKPVRPQIAAEGVEHYEQPDTKAKPVGEVGAKPVYLKLRPDSYREPASPTGSLYVQSGVATSDPQKYSGQILCPIDQTPLTIVGSQHGAWICQQGHQFDLSDTVPASWYVLSLTLPQGPAGGDPLGNENL